MKKLINDQVRSFLNFSYFLQSTKVKNAPKIKNNGKGPVKLWNSFRNGNIPAHKKAMGILKVRIAGITDSFNFLDEM